MLYLDQIRRADIDPVDLAEAVQRVIHTRESRSFPPLGEIFRQVRESRADRLKAEHDGPARLGEGMIRYGPHERRELQVWKSLAARGITYCDVESRWLEDTHCDHVPICHGAGVSLSEAQRKLASVAIRPLDPRRASWLSVLAVFS